MTSTVDINQITDLLASNVRLQSTKDMQEEGIRRALLGNDGKFLGILKMDPQSANILTKAINIFIPDIRDKGGMYLSTQILKHADKIPNAKNVASVTSNVYRYGIASLVTAMDIFSMAQGSVKALEMQSQAIEPVLRANGKRPGITSLLSVGDNEILQTARGRYFDGVKAGLAGSITTLPNTVFNLIGIKSADALTAAKAAGDEEAEEKAEATNNLYNRYGVIGASLASGLITNNIQDGRSKSQRQEIALDQIFKLRNFVFDHPKNISVHNVSEGVRNIFDQHQRDMIAAGKNENEISARFDELMNPMCDRIAEYIVSGKMDALALVNLVGERKVVKPGGRQFASERELEALLEKEAIRFRAGEPENVSEFYTETAYVKDEVKQLLKTLPEKEKALFASLLPDAALLDCGLKRKEVDQLRTQLSDQLQAELEGAVMDLLVTPPEELKAFGLTNAQIQELQELQQEWLRLGNEAITHAIGNPGKLGIEETVRDARGYWEEKVGGRDPVGSRFESFKAQAQAAAQQREEEMQATRDTLDAMPEVRMDSDRTNAEIAQDGGHRNAAALEALKTGPKDFLDRLSQERAADNSVVGRN